MTREATSYRGRGTPRTAPPAAGRALPRWERDPRVLWRCGPGFVVLLGPDDVTPTSLRGTGVALWAALDQARTVPDVAARLAAEFDADPKVVQSDVEPIIAS